MGEEINRLLEAKFIREIKEAIWFSPPVLVEKKDTKIYRMCIDFTALNKHCPKEYFPLPRIDQIIDLTAGCERLSFLDAYSGYNKIRLKVEDEDKTSFITPHGVYCYMTMPFGLKNAGATYQRCMKACLKEQIGRNIEVYVDDIVIKSTKSDSLLDDLRETFANLDRYSIKLNPKKCSFGVPTGQLLGYLISERGIKGNLEKIQAIINMQPPKTLRHVQQLRGRLAALSRFISKLGEKALPFYQLLRKTDNFTWTEEAQAAFDDLKHRLSTSPVLVTPREKELMLLYIAATNQVVSSALVVEVMLRTRKGWQGARGAKTGVLPQRGPVPDQVKVPPLSEAGVHHLHDREEAAALLRIPLHRGGGLDSSIQHPQQPQCHRAYFAMGNHPRALGDHVPTTVSDQVASPADLIAEWTKVQMPKLPDLSNCWTIYVDGSKRVSGAGAGVVLVSPQGDKMRYVLRMRFANPSTNEAEYEAVLHGMRMAKACGATRIKIHGDSNLIAQ
jgi:hypothetical protein